MLQQEHHQHYGAALWADMQWHWLMRWIIFQKTTQNGRN